MITLRLLGPVELDVEGHAAPRGMLWRKNLALLAYLARSPERRRSREHLIGLLWGDKPDVSARHSLNEALRVIRRSGGEDLIASIGDQVALDTEGVAVDVDLLETSLSREDWKAAADQVRGTFMEGFAVPDSSAFEDWLAAERTLWREAAVEALRRHAERQLARGDTWGAQNAAAAGLNLDPFSDAAVRLAMLAAALRGERAAALAAYDDYVRRLSEQLDVSPEPATEELAERIRSERTWSLPETVSEEDLWARRLPLVGREEEMQAAVATFRQSVGESRAALVVVQGESGSGKTRLGEELLARARLEGAATGRIRAVPTDAETAWSGLAGLASGGLLEAAGALRASPEALATILPHATTTQPRLAALAAGSAATTVDRGFVELVHAVSRTQPVVAWIDGADCLDADSAGALPGVLRDLEGRPFTLLLTAAAFPPEPFLDDLRSRIGRDLPGCTLMLGEIPSDAIETLAGAMMPGLTGEARARLARRIHADSAGLPLFAVELLNAVRLGLELEEVTGWPHPFRTMDQTYPGDLPDSVVAAIRIGFRRLSQTAQRLLTAASVLDERPGLATLGRATGLTGDALTEGLDELEWHRWLTAERRGYSFVARIVRDVIARDMLTAGQRQRILEAASS